MGARMVTSANASDGPGGSADGVILAVIRSDPPCCAARNVSGQLSAHPGSSLPLGLEDSGARFFFFGCSAGRSSGWGWSSSSSWARASPGQVAARHASATSHEAFRIRRTSLPPGGPPRQPSSMLRLDRLLPLPLADGDLLRLLLPLLGDGQLEHPVLELGGRVVQVGALRQHERPAEAAVRTLGRVERLPLVDLLLLAVPADGDAVAGAGDLQVLLLDARQVRLDEEGVRPLLHLEVRAEGGAAQAATHSRKRLPAQHLPHHPERVPLPSPADPRGTFVLLASANDGHVWHLPCVNVCTRE